MQLYAREPLMVSDYPAKSGGDRHCGSGDILCFCFARSREQKVM